MIPQLVLDKERRFRDAVEKHQYGELPELFEQMCQAADQYRVAETAERLIGTISWARTMVLIQRKVWADEAERLPMVSRYLEHSPTGMPGICTDL